MICQECGMSVFETEYHPYAACLMFKACRSSRTVTANLRAVMELGTDKKAKKSGEAYDFPMLDGPNIPLELAEQIYKKYSKKYGTDQSLERIKERGGFGWSEVPILFKKDVRRKC